MPRWLHRSYTATPKRFLVSTIRRSFWSRTSQICDLWASVFDMTDLAPTPPHLQPDPSGGPDYRIQLRNSPQPLDYSDPYIDIVWTPLVGPSATALLRSLAHTARSNPEQPTFTAAALAATIGVSPSRFGKALKRLQTESLLQVDGTHIALCNGIPTAPAYRLATLPDATRSYATNRHQTLPHGRSTP